MRFRSINEEVAYDILKMCFPNTRIVHDYNVGERLKVDFVVVSSLLIGFEIDGAQHYSYNSRFHRSRNDWKVQRKLDYRKEELCRDKGILLIRIDARHGVSENVVREKIANALATSDIPDVEDNPVDKAVKYRKKHYRNQSYRLYKQRLKDWKNNNTGGM